MSEVITPAPGSAPAHAGGGLWPRTTLGWWAVALAIVALVCVPLFPVLTMTLRDTYPVVDTWVMPVVLMALLDAAAVLSLLAVWLRHERSVLSIAALAVTLLSGLFFTFMVVGEAIGGA